MGFNTRQYEWSDSTLILGGKDITGIRGFKITEKIEREAIYGKGKNPHSIQSGNASYEGEVTVLQSEYEALVTAGGGSIMSLSLDGLFSYGNPPDPIVTKKVSGIRFTEASNEFKQGDKFMEITLPFVALNITNI